LFTFHKMYLLDYTKNVRLNQSKVYKVHKFPGLCGYFVNWQLSFDNW